MTGGTAVRSIDVLEDTIVEEDIHPVYVSAGATDVGRLRSSNQDAFAEMTDAGLWVVADGMGGYRDGDVASRMVCEGLQGLAAGVGLEATVDEIRQRMSDVNHRLHQAAVRPVDPVISGSTVAILLTRRTACALLWAGDSRIYRLRHGRLAQLTTDHTWAAELNLQSPREEADHAITRGPETGSCSARMACLTSSTTSRSRPCCRRASPSNASAR
jgi:serine/threonine protein phosphatase PrpC